MSKNDPLGIDPLSLEELGDPLHPPPPPNVMPRFARPRSLDRPEDYSKSSPVQRAIKYENEYWLQQLVPVVTRCLRCETDSPVVFIPWGTLMFGKAKYKPKPGEIDVTKQAVEAFAKIGWKFQLKKSYCPDCKNLGSV